MPEHAETIRYEGEPVPVRVGLLNVVEVPSRIFRARLKGMLFDTMRTFLLPGALNSIRRLKGYYDRHPGAEVLVVGHTDTSGQERYNLKLSGERAESVAAYLQDDVESWLAWYEYVNAPFESTPKKWDAREDKQMLSALGDEEGTFFEGPVDAEETPALEASVRRFQEWRNRTGGTGLGVDGDAGPNTRRELIRAYMAQDETTLPEGTRIEVHGCGESHPEVETGDDATEAENRRVEVFLFEHGIGPEPQAECPDGGCAEWDEWVGGTTETVDLRDQEPVEPGRIFTLELFDDVLLPDDTELVVSGLPSPLRFKTVEQHDPEEGVYSFPIHDPPPYSSCRASLVSEKGTHVLFEGVDLSRFIEEAVEEGDPPFLPIDLPDETFDTRVEEEEKEPEPPASAFSKPFEDHVQEDCHGDVDFPVQHDHSGVFEDPDEAN